MGIGRERRLGKNGIQQELGTTQIVTRQKKEANKERSNNSDKDGRKFYFKGNFLYIMTNFESG